MEDKSRKQCADTMACTLEIKSLEADGRFAGYASVFGMVDSQRDIVRAGAFARSIKSRTAPLQLLWQHQWESPIGTIDTMFEDPRGLYVEGKLLMAVTRAREAYALLKANVLRGLSIGYSVKNYRRDPDSGVRELIEVELWEVSLVTLPANEAAQVTVLKQADVAELEIASLAQAVRQARQVLET